MKVKYLENGQPAETDIPEALARQIAALQTGKAQAEADAAALAKTWKNILKLFDLEGKTAAAVMMQIPRLIAKIQREPELFNFIDPALNQIIDKYSS
jgi:hypothetical protein